MASERARATIRLDRDIWITKRQPRMQLEPHRLVFIDETSVNIKMVRLRGRCPRGQRLRMEAPFGHWGTQTFIAGIRCFGLTAPWILNTPMNLAAFDCYVETQLAPTLSRGDVVILDNLAVYKSKRAAEILQDHGAWFLFLPPYSRDLNPIEMMFAKLKLLVRKAEERTVETTWRRIGQLLTAFTPQECSNYLRHAGYASN